MWIKIRYIIAKLIRAITPESVAMREGRQLCELGYIPGKSNYMLYSEDQNGNKSIWGFFARNDYEALAMVEVNMEIEGEITPESFRDAGGSILYRITGRTRRGVSKLRIFPYPEDFSPSLVEANQG